MASEEAQKWIDLYRSIGTLEAQQTDLRVIRSIFETLHSGASEPEGVTYAEVDADGVPAMWCIPRGCDADRVLLHCHAGGTPCSRCTPTASWWDISPRRQGSELWGWWTSGAHRKIHTPPRWKTSRLLIAGCE